MAREKLSDFLYLDKKGRYSFYLKSPTIDYYFRSPETEHRGYNLISEHLRMPNVRLAPTNSGPILVVRGIDAPAANALLTSHPERIVSPLRQFLLDMVVMWQKTLSEINEDQLTRNWKNETIEMLSKIQSLNEFREIGDKQIVVNGIRYPNLLNTLTQSMNSLQNVSEPNMVLSHGDEHLGNILVDGESYWAIDPGNYSGYNYISAALNNLIGSLYIFEYRYNAFILQEENKVSVDFQLKEDWQEAELILYPVLIDFVQKASEMNQESTFFKDFLFANELRIAFGLTKRAIDLTEILRNRMLFIGLAVEHYYSNKFHQGLQNQAVA